MFEFNCINTNVATHDLFSSLFVEFHMVFSIYTCMKQHTHLLSSLLKLQKKINGATILKQPNVLLKKGKLTVDSIFNRRVLHPPFSS